MVYVNDSQIIKETNNEISSRTKNGITNEMGIEKKIELYF